MMASPHTLVEGVIIASYAIRANHAFIYVRGEVLHVVRRLQRAVAGGLPRRPPRQGHPRLRLRPRRSSCTPAPAPTSAARRPRCSTRSRAAAASRGCARRSPPSPASTPAPTVINNVESIASVPCIVAQRRRLVRLDGHREVQGHDALLAVRPRQAARPVRSAARHHAARAARPRRRRPRGPRAEVLDPGGSSHADADRRAPRRARSTTRASARPARCSAPRRCRSSTRPPAWSARCCAGPSSTSTSPAASARRAARAPGGWCRSWPGSRRARAREDDLELLLDQCDNILGRSFCALGDGATSPITSSIQYFRDEYLAHLDARRLPVRPGRLHALRHRRSERMTVTPATGSTRASRRPTWSR